MKLLQLQHFFYIFFFFLLGFTPALAQRDVAPSLHSYYGTGNISHCAGEPLDLFVFGDYLPNDPRISEYDYEVFRIRGGITTTIRFRASTYSIIIPANDVLVGDEYYAISYTYSPTAVQARTNSIIVNSSSNSQTLNTGDTSFILQSDLQNDVYCEGELFSLFTLGAGMEYTFFREGIQLGIRSTNNSITPSNLTTDTQFSVTVHTSNNCEVTATKIIKVMLFDPGSIDGNKKHGSKNRYFCVPRLSAE